MKATGTKRGESYAESTGDETGCGVHAESGKMTIRKDGLMTFPVQGYLSGKSQHAGCAMCHSPLSGQELLGQINRVQDGHMQGLLVVYF